MIAASLTKPSKFSDLCSHRLQMRRKFFSHENSLSIFQRRTYRRSSWPSCVGGRTLPLRCGEIIRTFLFRSRASSPSSSYALSPMSLPGDLPVIKGPFNQLSFVYRGSGNMKSDRKTIAVCHCHDLVPFPTFVGPTSGPPFLPPRRWHRYSTLKDRAFLVFGDLPPKLLESRPSRPPLPISENSDGRFGTEDNRDGVQPKERQSA